MTKRREKYIHCRVNPIERQALDVLATLEKRSPSEMMRELIREGMRNRDLDIFNLNDLIERFPSNGVYPVKRKPSG